MCKYFGGDFSSKNVHPAKSALYKALYKKRFLGLKAFFFKNIFPYNIFFILLYVIKQYYPT